MSSLNQMIAKVSLFETLIVDAGGEITPEIENELAIIEKSIAERVDDLSFYMERLDMLSEHWKLKSKQLNQLAKGCEAVKERIKSSIKFGMNARGTKELSGNEIRFKLSEQKQKLVVDDEGLLPKNCLSEKITLVPNKEVIIEALVNGLDVPGAHIENYCMLRTYPVKKGGA